MSNAVVVFLATTGLSGKITFPPSPWLTALVLRIARRSLIPSSNDAIRLAASMHPISEADEVKCLNISFSNKLSIWAWRDLTNCR